MMSDIEKFIKDHIKITEQVYRLSPERMFSEYNGEKENVSNYNGRQLLEMLQNADDAASEAVNEKKALIRLNGNQLLIANTGYKFSKQGLKSIFHSHLSPKQAREKQIGKKGLGFRSILSWAEKVTIHSHDFSVAFSESHSKSILDKFLNDDSFKDAFDDLNIRNEKSPISTLVCPELISLTDSFIEGYDTTIEIILRDEAIDQLKLQVRNDISGEVLLFLNNLKQVDIDINGEKKSYQKELVPGNQIIITKIISKRMSIKTWNVHTISGHFEDLDKPYELSIAWNDDLDSRKNTLYSYFRTKVEVPSNGILHGSFELNADRNLLIPDAEGYNALLLSLLPQLLCETAALIVAKNPSANYNALRILDVDCSNIKGFIEQKSLEQNIRARIKDSAVFPTIAGEYLPWRQGNEPVYYNNGIFARHLSPNSFPLLMPVCEDENIEKLIESLKPRVYVIKGIIADVLKKKDELTTQEYAQLIWAIHENINKNNIDSLKPLALFFDADRNPLSFNQPIFLPQNGKPYRFPKEIGIQIISEDLVKELMIAGDCINHSAIIQKLNYFSLKEYTFTELVERIILHYKSDKSAVKIAQLHINLFSIYDSITETGTRWTGTPCPLLNKKKQASIATQLYFGKEYGNPLIEEVYNYDRSKIVSSPATLKPAEASFEKWGKYLEWLGVVHLPRMVKKNGDADYADYCMKNYNFRNSSDSTYNPKNFTEFKKILNKYGTVTVTTIDGLENILSKCSSETILRLLNAYEPILQLLEKNREPDGASIQLDYYSSKNWRTVNSNSMKSYIKWVIGKTPWLQSESGTKAAPMASATAGYINEDFQGFVEKPKLDYDTLKRYGIERDKIDHLLWLIGVHKTINSFPTTLLYSMLLNLPLIDPSGKKAKTIYNQLAVNYDEKLLDRLDTTDPIYKEFHESGQVYCRDGKYIPAKKAFYVQDKRYGETVLRQFSIIEVDRRRSREKITKLFGVPPLEKIDLSVVDAPEDHMLNSVFITEMEHFKPYVYTLRKDMDSGHEKTIIKEVKFKLVKKLNLKLIKDNHEQLVTLNDYEYYYDRKRKTVYFVADSNYNDIAEIKDEIPFCSAVADAFSAILDVDSQRQQIRELFSKDGTARDELLRSELDDLNLRRLQEAREILGIISNPRLEFWKSFVKCFPQKRFVLKDTESELLLQLGKKFLKTASLINDVFDKINYDDLNDYVSSELIIKLLSGSGKTIALFNNYHYPSLDITELYSMHFIELLEKKQNLVTSHYFNRCVKDISLQTTFIDYISRYTTLQPNVINEVNFTECVAADIEKQVHDLFGIDSGLIVSPVNLQEIYNTNVNEFWLLKKKSNESNALFIQFLNEHPQIQSRMYFSAQIPSVAAEFENWLGKAPNPTSPDASGSKRFTLGKDVLLYDNIVDLKSKFDNLLGEDGLINVTASSLKTAPLENLNKRHSGTSNGSVTRKPTVPKEEVGFLGEYIVYQYLLRTIQNKESVKWVSDYARQCNVNPLGRDGLGYDIEYIPNNSGKKRYIEVKVVSWENAFHISSGEIRFGEKYRKDYDIYLVRGTENPATAKIERMMRPFDYKGKTFNNNGLFSVINDNYIIKFNKV